jgi:hypothetical protein
LVDGPVAAPDQGIPSHDIDGADKDATKVNAADFTLRSRVDDLDEAILAARVQFALGEPKGRNEATRVHFNGPTALSAIPEIDQRVGAPCVAGAIIAISGTGERCGFPSPAKDALVSLQDAWIPEFDMLRPYRYDLGSILGES